ncbi:hypothetical protein ACIQTU_06215 [Brevundimonas sp. NPDC090276]
MNLFILQPAALVWSIFPDRDRRLAQTKSIAASQENRQAVKTNVLQI